MKKLRYKGMFDEVQIAPTGQWVKQGESVEVEDDAIADSLLEQTDNWEKTPTAKEK